MNQDSSQPLARDAPDLRYPTGHFMLSEAPLTAAERLELINQLANLPAQLRAAVAEAGPEQMRRAYRPEGWSRHQMVHHVADSHLTGYVQFRLALTEDGPAIRPYNEKAWAELPDVENTPVEVSLSLLASLHSRWVVLLLHLSEAQWQRTCYSAEQERMFTLDQALALYVWHGRHHLGHVLSPYLSPTEAE